MKKLIVLVITLTLMLLLSSCNIQLYKLPHDAFCYSDTDTVVELETEEKEYIINLLNEGKWHPDVAKCTTDYNFYTQKQSLGYNAEEGIFNDFTLSRSLKLSEEDRIAVNLYLGYKDADETPLTPSPDKTYSFEEIYNLSSYINLDEITSIKIDFNRGYLGRAMMHDVSITTDQGYINSVKEFIKNSVFSVGLLSDGASIYSVTLLAGDKPFNFHFSSGDEFVTSGYDFTSSIPFPLTDKFDEGYNYLQPIMNKIEYYSYGEVKTLTDFDITEIHLTPIEYEMVAYDYTKDAYLKIENEVFNIISKDTIYSSSRGYYKVVGEKDFASLIPKGEKTSKITFADENGKELGVIIVSDDIVYTLDEIEAVLRTITNGTRFEIKNKNGESFTDREFTKDETLTVKITPRC